MEREIQEESECEIQGESESESESESWVRSDFMKFEIQGDPQLTMLGMNHIIM